MISEYAKWFVENPIGQVIALTNEIRKLDGKDYWPPEAINRQISKVYKMTKKGPKMRKGMEKIDEELGYKEELSWSENIDRWLKIFNIPFEYEYKIYCWQDLFYEITILDDRGQEFSYLEMGSFICAYGKVVAQASPNGDLHYEIIEEEDGKV